MKICRFQDSAGRVRVGLISHKDSVVDLGAAGITDLGALLEAEDLDATLSALAARDLPSRPLSSVRLLAPVDRQEIWAAGVTYLRSKTARMEESDFSANAYDRVYAAERPELFFKSIADKVVAPGGEVGIRRDARWNVPEPELALVINSRAQVVGCTIGNDMSSRDIEGENLLYLPQAKVYRNSCALGPCITIGVSEADVRTWKISVEIHRKGDVIFGGETSVGQIKRSFEELVGFLFRSQVFPHGAVLLTGTGVVPADSFTLHEADIIRMHISGIGVLSNTVATV